MPALFYHAGALGDFLTVLPAIRAWRYLHPYDKIVLLGKPAFGLLALHNGYIDEINDVESAVNIWLFSTDSSIPKTGLTKYSQISRALLFCDPDSPIIVRLSHLGVRDIAAQTVLPSRRIPIALHRLSLVQGGMQLLDHFGPVICPHSDFEPAAHQLLSGFDQFITIHPGSGSRIKNWPVENFAILSRRLHDRGLKTVWICGNAEDGLRLPGSSFVIRNVPLPVLVHVLKRSRAYIGNDSGISHLAASVGCRCFILFGPSDEIVWGPSGSHVSIMKARRSCSPCHPARGDRSTCNETCMRLLPVEEVYERIIRAGLG